MFKFEVSFVSKLPFISSNIVWGGPGVVGWFNNMLSFFFFAWIFSYCKSISFSIAVCNLIDE